MNEPSTSYRRQLLLSASPVTVYHAVATQQGLRGWWTETCDIATAVGGYSLFRFNRTRKVMQIERLVPEREVRWHCLEAYIDVDRLQQKDEWVGTHIIFRLSPQAGGKTRLDFEHVGLTPALDCFDVCNDGWNHFLASLQALVETGHGNPWMAKQLVMEA